MNKSLAALGLIIVAGIVAFMSLFVVRRFSGIVLQFGRRSQPSRTLA